MATHIRFRRGTAAQWTSANPILLSGEPGFETDTGKVKVGNGSTTWNSLTYLNFDVVTETVHDIVGSLIIAGAGISVAYDDPGGSITISATGGGGGGGVTDHGALTGLADDDHPQYHNNARGDVRYYTKAQVDAAVAAVVVPTATTTVQGKVELSTQTELTAGTDPARVPPVSVVALALSQKAAIDHTHPPSDHTHVAADITDVDFNDFVTSRNGFYWLDWNATTSSYPNRSLSGTSDPNMRVWYFGGPGPAQSGTGSTGACAKDLYVAALGV